jgi:hypothetical protein
MSREERVQELLKRISRAREQDPHFYAKRAAKPRAIARHAFHSSAVEGQTLSMERLVELAETTTVE